MHPDYCFGGCDECRRAVCGNASHQNAMDQLTNAVAQMNANIANAPTPLAADDTSSGEDWWRHTKNSAKSTYRRITKK